ncbi:MAG: Ditrans,polycis-undecaprenyl-diphosphate synthase ((2E,6E)-farnesyl-diphosphate specific) [Cryomorphaceae bacterium]|nr:MAG: Ditrans,polycis-undecaprenyl-diphosphate synthase ((2E,6E)-farnesyl-diphosphate specific) [Cryomorphaceae bacterium]
MEKIDITNLPRHIAITMDGNGRWAKSKGKLRIFGHKNGVEAVRDTIEGAAEIGIKYITLYAFSSENWNRPEKEVNALMTLLVSAINKETKTLMDNNIQLKTIGDINKLPLKAQKELQEAITKTKDNTRMTLVLALSYSGRGEILNAVQEIIKEGKEPEEINEDTFQQYLTTKSVPDPELLIRTSGEYRISNFLLWQIAYSELYFTDTLWPDFRRADLYKAILNYQSRERRFGKTTEQYT